MDSCGNSYDFLGNNGGSCGAGLGRIDPFEPGICRLMSTDTRHPAMR